MRCLQRNCEETMEENKKNILALARVLMDVITFYVLMLYANSRGNIYTIYILKSKSG